MWVYVVSQSVITNQLKLIDEGRFNVSGGSTDGHGSLCIYYLIIKALNMKQTYIEFDGYDYPASACTFYKDCVVHYDHDSNETIMHNGHWKYIEKDIVFDQLTLVEREREIENQIRNTKLQDHREKVRIDFIAQHGHKPTDYDEYKKWWVKYREYKEAHPFAG